MATPVLGVLVPARGAPRTPLLDLGASQPMLPSRKVKKINKKVPFWAKIDEEINFSFFLDGLKDLLFYADNIFSENHRLRCLIA